MQVFKFGGASIRNAGAIRKVAEIIRQNQEKNLLVVVSAMGKTTNALERLVPDFQTGKNVQQDLQPIRSYHEDVLKELFKLEHPVWNKVNDEFEALSKAFDPPLPYDQCYDQVVSIGEMVSSIILASFLDQEGIPVEWIDVRKFIATDDTYREGKVDWKTTEKNIQELKSGISNKIILTQGFIGKSPDGFTTTLGREGSDFSAAIFASCLGAQSVTIWKDVPGVMNADPKRIQEAIVFEELPFREAAEMTYYGASVIHPKTIKPLANKNIPLYVMNFDDPTLPGTIIHETKINSLPPLIVFKDNQCLVSCRVTDYTFIDEQQLSFIFSVLSELDLKINVMQNSAISFSFCIDFREDKVLKLISRLSSHFEVYYNTDLTLITIKNYDATTYEAYRKKSGVILEQSSRSTLQILIKN